MLSGEVLGIIQSFGNLWDNLALSGVCRRFAAFNGPISYLAAQRKGGCFDGKEQHNFASRTRDYFRAFICDWAFDELCRRPGIWRHVDLSGLQLTHAQRVQLSQGAAFTGVRTLVLGRNQSSDTSLTRFAPNIQSLCFYGATTQLPAMVEGLTQLTHLDLRCLMDDVIPDSAGFAAALKKAVPHLTSVHVELWDRLHGNSNALARAMTIFPVTRMHGISRMADGTVFSAVARCSTITDLQIRQQHEYLSLVSQMPSVTRLALFALSGRAGYEAIAPLAKMENLRRLELDVDATGQTAGLFIDHIGQLTQLRQLSLSGDILRNQNNVKKLAIRIPRTLDRLVITFTKRVLLKTLTDFVQARPAREQILFVASYGTEFSLRKMARSLLGQFPDRVVRITTTSNFATINLSETGSYFA
jgi:hypothetical protein